MTEKINRRELIINTAAELFSKQGYDGTSVRQIADCVGVTEAALYYHFKDGKRGLLREVVECNLPSLVGALEACDSARTLAELVVLFVRGLMRIAPEKVAFLRWVMAEFPNLSPEERAVFHQKHTFFQKTLAELVRRFIPDAHEADRTAWMIICATFGYGQLFINLEVASLVDFAPDEFAQRLAGVIAGGKT